MAKAKKIKESQVPWEALDQLMPYEVGSYTFYLEKGVILCCSNNVPCNEVYWSGEQRRWICVDE